MLSITVTEPCSELGLTILKVAFSGSKSLFSTSSMKDSAAPNTKLSFVATGAALVGSICRLSMAVVKPPLPSFKT